MPATLPKAKLKDIQADRRHPSSEFRILSVPFSDVNAINDGTAIDDATEVYGDWPEIETPCDKSPDGECRFNCLAGADHDVCICCGKDWS